MRRGCLILTACVAALAWPAPTAAAHGVQGRAQTPIPLSAFYYAGAAVLVVSFVGLAFGWSTARLDRPAWRPAPAWLSRAVLSRAARWGLRALVLGTALLVLAAAALGSTELNANPAPVAVFVVWWIGLVPVSALFGNVWREVNPWTTLARLARFPSRGRGLPERVGVWPAVGLLLAFGWLELVYPTASSP